MAMTPTAETESLRPVSPSAPSMSRAVPVLVKDLRALLRAEVMEGPVEALFVVEHQLISGGSLHMVAQDVIKEALIQLDRLGCRTPGLGILRLQMTRQIGANDARHQVAQGSSAMNWRPEQKQRSKHKDESTLQFEDGFPDTVSSRPSAVGGVGR